MPAPEKQYLILAKHARPEIDPALPPAKWVLSEAGRGRSKALGEQLARYRVEAVVSSEEPKAVETARLAAARLRLRASTAPGLHEHVRTAADFVDGDQFEKKIQDFFLQPQKLVFGQETASQAYQRFSEALDEVLSEIVPSLSGSLAVVAHGTVISLYVSRVCGLEPFPLWQRLGMPSFVAISLPRFSVDEVWEGG